jgi:ribosomal protein S18 acetylase RimI-like enzyme
LIVRPAGAADAGAIWEVLRPVFRAGDTYAVDPGIGRAAALGYWMAPAHAAFVAEADEVIGTGYLRANQGGGGAHVANAAFATSPAARGRGVAGAMLSHAMDAARAAGFEAMQFNFVLASNGGAARLWQRAGFAEVGRVPRAFRLPSGDYTDAQVMYRAL